ncbi:hypothetical protein QWI17_11895 [Gilvimarinus sp. SDUM040013]|uniref:Uncharacterized protein n=1 Tax=Gilvimarinus gilvus TaxID=3058038 RepID=A0ABU4S1K8_9GAMM|nr:hypothetical protein [Gilvimarinus sp. SDUM040013]MDO3386538.1 hypothetical protein [Gilvimarinus sp. SDUM040013]MDX6849114.1 hypothetical protein [Gilvimarinus sp. SDUM040013]
MKFSGEIEEIRKRWHYQELVGGWRSLPSKRRDEVASDIEESARELQGTMPELSSDLMVAVDALESLAVAGDVESHSQAIKDIKTLLKALAEK